VRGDRDWYGEMAQRLWIRQCRLAPQLQVLRRSQSLCNDHARTIVTEVPRRPGWCACKSPSMASRYACRRWRLTACGKEWSREAQALTAWSRGVTVLLGRCEYGQGRATCQAGSARLALLLAQTGNAGPLVLCVIVVSFRWSKR
jgi:hypothetical protein